MVDRKRSTANRGEVRWSSECRGCFCVTNRDVGLFVGSRAGHWAVCSRERFGLPVLFPPSMTLTEQLAKSERRLAGRVESSREGDRTARPRHDVFRSFDVIRDSTSAYKKDVRSRSRDSAPQVGGPRAADGDQDRHARMGGPAAGYQGDLRLRCRTPLVRCRSERPPRLLHEVSGACRPDDLRTTLTAEFANAPTRTSRALLTRCPRNRFAAGS